MIPSYRETRTGVFAEGALVRAVQGFERQAYKRLEILDAAESLDGLRALLSNRLEALGPIGPGSSASGSTAVADLLQWPLGAAGPGDVEIVDFH
jgi:proteic killer suppression protein